MIDKVLSQIYGDDQYVRTLKIKRGDGAANTYSFKYLYSMELLLTSGDRTEPTNIVEKCSPFNGDVELSICPACNVPENFRPVICCDTCNLWYH